MEGKRVMSEEEQKLEGKKVKLGKTAGGVRDKGRLKLHCGKHRRGGGH